jgi:hypothetical protein
MKITKEYLQQIIKEELEAVLNEEKVKLIFEGGKYGLDGGRRRTLRQDIEDIEKETAATERRTAGKQAYYDRTGRYYDDESTERHGPRDIIQLDPSSLYEEEFYEVDALGENEEYCPACAPLEEKKKKKKKKKKKACKPSKGKRFAKRVDGKCRSFGQAGQAKSGGDRIRPGTAKGDAYCARSAGIKKCKNPPCANTLSRKKWKCRGKKSMK